jgi:hypothetical protein
MTANAFFDGWMAKWSRKIFIAKVLGRVTRGWTMPRIDAGSKTELKAALRAIDSFPRRALLLTVFEKLLPEDVAVLLNSDQECVRTGTAIGLMELTRNLTRAQHQSVTVWAPSRHDSRDQVPVF